MLDNQLRKPDYKETLALLRWYCHYKGVQLTLMVYHPMCNGQCMEQYEACLTIANDEFVFFREYYLSYEYDDAERAVIEASAYQILDYAAYKMIDGIKKFYSENNKISS